MCTACAQLAIGLAETMTTTTSSAAIAPRRPAREAAPGVARTDVEAVNARPRRNLYEVRKTIYPKLAFGKFRLIKWAVMAVTLGIYYVLPWLRWSRGPDLPDQAVRVLSSRDAAEIDLKRTAAGRLSG